MAAVPLTREDLHNGPGKEELPEELQNAERDDTVCKCVTHNHALTDCRWAGFHQSPHPTHTATSSTVVHPVTVASREDVACAVRACVRTAGIAALRT